MVGRVEDRWRECQLLTPRSAERAQGLLRPQRAQRSRLKWLMSGNEDLWHLGTMNYLASPMKQAVLHRLPQWVTPYPVGQGLGCVTRGNTL